MTFKVEDLVDATKIRREKAIESTIVKHLKNKFNDSIYEIPKPIRASSKGSPDRQFLINGRFVAIEMKKIGEKARSIQLKRINEIRKAGGIAFVASSLNDVIECLQGEELC